ncbi:M23 family metallopeptidase [Nocardia grenadensis]|uniref:M23 family metallopeptidase n=1 Tax=Nocardia grenadensis TaxID=931537 RepID=UPI003D71C2F8
MNHRGTLDAHPDGRARRRHENAQPAEATQSFNAFGVPGDSRSRRRPLNTAAASAAADAHRTAADDFWTTNQGWADSRADSWSGGEQQAQDNWQQGGWQQNDKPVWHSDPNWNTHQSWTEAQSWSDAPAQSWPEPAPYAPGGRAASDHYAAPTTIAEALENAPVADETPEETRRSRSRGAHRVAAPPSALKGRAAVVAVAAGAVVAAGQCATAEPTDQKHAQQATDYEAAGSVHEIAAQSMATEDPAAAVSSTASPQMLGGNLPVDTSRFGEMLANGAQFAEDLAQAEEAKFRPLFAKFANGAYTSGFGARWGVQHLGIDVAAPIGTPIYAVADGEVIDAGPASGFGMWVRLLHADGTITVYGHVDTTTVGVGEYVFAGDQIATVGNRGFSTGPHCHFEVWLNGSDKIDPVPWLATRGISLTGNGD